MIIHCSKKLAAKLSKEKLSKEQLNIQTEAETEASSLSNWNAQLFEIDKRECVLFTHDTTRYSIFIPGLGQSQYQNFEQCFKDMFMASLFELGIPDNQLIQVELALGKMILDSNTSPSVMGSMNNLKRMISQRSERVPDVMDLDIMATNQWLAEIPMKGKDIGDYVLPDDEMKALISALT